MSNFDLGTQWKWRLYMTLVSVTLFVIPAFLIGGCYIIIVVTIWRKACSILHQPKQSSSKVADFDTHHIFRMNSYCTLLYTSYSRNCIQSCRIYGKIVIK